VTRDSANQRRETKRATKGLLSGRALKAVMVSF